MTPEERAAEIGDWVLQLTPDRARQMIANAIRAAVLEEREACAKLVEEDDDVDDGYDSAETVLTKSLAEAIRDRGR